MEYTAIGKEKEKFVPRKSYKEFHRDGEVIEELYELTDTLMANEYNIPYGEYTLQVFNHAYRICWMCIAGKSSVGQIRPLLMDEKEMIREYSLAVAYALFLLHGMFYPFPINVRKFLIIQIPARLRQRYFAFVKGKTLLYPIDFCASIPVLDFSGDIMDIEDLAIRLEKDNKRLRKQQESTYAESVRNKNLVKELMEQNSLLQQKLGKLENDELCKVVNLETIAKYSLRQTNPQIVETIVNMLNRLCVGKRCVPEPLQKRIEDLEDYIIALKKPNIQNNNGCQQFFGPVTDSNIMHD